MRIKSRRLATHDVLAVACLLTCWILAVWLTNPRGNFPIVDDWAYVSSLVQLRTTGRLVLSDWTAANLISQLILTLPFTLVLPPDFETARLASLVIGGFVGPVLYTNLRLVGARPAIATIFAASFVFNPIFFFLSFTYMTDIYYTALQALTGLLLALAVLRSSTLALVLGWLTGIAALLSRQLATAIPIAFAIATLATRRWTVARVVVCAAFVASFVAIQSGFRAYLAWSGKLPRNYGRQSDDLIAVFHQPLTHTLGWAAEFLVALFFYAGLLLLPCTIIILVLHLAPKSRKARLIAVSAIGLLTIGSVAVLHFSHKSMPYFGDTLTAWGIGNDLMAPIWWPWYRRVLTFIAAVGGGMLVICLVFVAETVLGLVKRMSFDEEARTRLTLLAFYAVMPLVLLAPIFVVNIRFDRYMLPALLSCIVMLAVSIDLVSVGRRKWRLGLAAAGMATAVFLIASVVFTHDYLTARRVEWQAMNDLVATGVRPDHIDAGWVFNGLNSYGKFGDPSWIEGWYERRDYVIGLAPEPGFEAVQTLSASGWAPWTHAWKVYVLKGPTS